MHTNVTILFFLIVVVGYSQSARQLSNSEVKARIAQIQTNQNPQATIAPLRQLLDQLGPKEDSSRAVVMLELGSNYGRIYNNDSAMFFLAQAVLLSKSNRWAVLAGEIYNYSGNVMRNRSDNQKAMQYYDSALHVLAGGERDRYICEAKVLGNMGGIHYDLGEFEKALEFAEKATAMIENHGLVYRETSAFYVSRFLQRTALRCP